ncbi:MAG TPA: hypothetical protein VMR37_07520 [Rhabdochlamydiaceae bacterium]|nr:hypothetical protein [Rhabdochlamydiaceae bacterium]
MAAVVLTGKPATIAWGDEQQNGLKATLHTGIDTSVDVATPLVAAAVKAGVNSCAAKSTDATGGCLKARVSPCVTPANVPVVHQVVDGAAAVTKEVAQQVAAPLVDQCVASTATIAKQSIKKGTNSCVDNLGRMSQKV